MPNLVAISQVTTKINRGAESAPPQALSVSNHPGQIGLNTNETKMLEIFHKTGGCILTRPWVTCCEKLIVSLQGTSAKLGVRHVHETFLIKTRHPDFSYMPIGPVAKEYPLVFISQSYIDKTHSSILSLCHSTTILQDTKS